jgi:hypothetical protein
MHTDIQPTVLCSDSLMYSRPVAPNLSPLTVHDHDPSHCSVILSVTGCRQLRPSYHHSTLCFACSEIQVWAKRQDIAISHDRHCNQPQQTLQSDTTDIAIRHNRHCNQPQQTLQSATTDSAISHNRHCNQPQQTLQPATTDIATSHNRHCNQQQQTLQSATTDIAISHNRHCNQPQQTP